MQPVEQRDILREVRRGVAVFGVMGFILWQVFPPKGGQLSDIVVWILMICLALYAGYFVLAFAAISVPSLVGPMLDSLDIRRILKGEFSAAEVTAGTLQMEFGSSRESVTRELAAPQIPSSLRVLTLRIQLLVRDYGADVTVRLSPAHARELSAALTAAAARLDEDFVSWQRSWQRERASTE
jgi:hypothetical protein